MYKLFCDGMYVQLTAEQVCHEETLYGFNLTDQEELGTNFPLLSLAKKYQETLQKFTEYEILVVEL